MRTVRFLDLSVQNNEERHLLLQCLEDHLSSGRWIIPDTESEFERTFKSIHSRAFAIGVNSGTHALQLALELLRLPPGSKVLTSCFSWLATASSISLAGHIPVFVDTDHSLNINLNLLEEYLINNPDIAAIVIPHLHGNTVNLSRLDEISVRYNIPVIEDCAQSFLSSDNDARLSGSLGKFSCFSFNPMKVLGGLGDAGLLLFDCQTFVDDAYSMRHSGLSSRDKTAIILSSNYRLDNLQASFLCSRLPFVRSKIEQKRQLARAYSERLDKRISILVDNPLHSNFYCLQTLIPSIVRDAMVSTCSEHGIEVKIRHDFLLPDLPIFQNQYNDIDSFPVARTLLNQILCLPLHEYMTIEDVHYVCDVCNSVLA